MSALTSNTYQFGINTQLDDLFRDAFERIGIVGNEQTPLLVQSAIMSANLELSIWPGKGLNLWMVQQQMFTVVAGQPIYSLPLNTARILEVIATQPARLNTGGTAFSTAGGIAANCFDPTQTAGCVQTTHNGSIGYDYGVGQSNSILYVGITPLITSTYTLSVEYSFDTVNWIPVYKAPTQSYPAFQITWFVIQQSLSARAWRITETNGATLAIQQIYFNQPATTSVGDRMLTALSRYEWLAISNKMSQNSGNTLPSSFYFNQQITPTMTLWPVPGTVSPGTQPNILYTSYRYVQDVTQMYQDVEIPQRFYDALVSALAARLALKFMPDKYQILKAESIEAYNIAAATDFEKVTLRFTPDFGPYGVH